MALETRIGIVKLSLLADSVSLPHLPRERRSADAVGPPNGTDRRRRPQWAGDFAAIVCARPNAWLCLGHLRPSKLAFPVLCHDTPLDDAEHLRPDRNHGHEQ